MARERVGIQHLRHLRRQAVEAIAHADRTAGQIHLGARRDLDHDAAFNTASTRRSARSLTKASTRSRVPSARSISITPGRSSMAGRGGVARLDDDPATTPVRTRRPAQVLVLRPANDADRDELGGPDRRRQRIRLQAHRG